MFLHKLSRSRVMLFGTVSVLLVVVGTVMWFMNNKKPIAKTTTVPQTKTYLRISELPAATSTKEVIVQALEKAFWDQKLYEAASWPIPQRDDERLVLATPTLTGKVGAFACGSFFQYPYCGLYIKTATTSRLIAWGESLAGFDNVEDIQDANHFRVGYSFTFLNYSSVAHKSLNLQTGEIVPLLNMEIDLVDTSASMLVTGLGHDLTLDVKGERLSDGLMPLEVSLKDASGHTVYQIPANEISQLKTSAGTNADNSIPLLLLPSKDDVSTEILHVKIYGVTYQLDLKSKTLKPVSALN
jgi:hypothetical protein